MGNIEVNRPYLHFKCNLYYVHSIVEDTETGESLYIKTLFFKTQQKA